MWQQLQCNTPHPKEDMVTDVAAHQLYLVAVVSNAVDTALLSTCLACSLKLFELPVVCFDFDCMLGQLASTLALKSAVRLELQAGANICAMQSLTQPISALTFTHAL